MTKKPRFQMFPEAYSVGKLGSIVPNTEVGDFQVTRNSIGTRVNKDGLIEVMDANVPRLDYSDGGCPKLLTESSGTNLVASSEDFTASLININKNQSSIDGTNNASLITRNGTSGQYAKTSNATFSSSGTRTTTSSLYFKKSNAPYLAITIRDDIGQKIELTINLSNNSITTQNQVGMFLVGASVSDKTIKGFYRFSATITTYSSPYIYMRVAPRSDNYIVNASDSNGGGLSAIIVGGQIEISSFSSSYIPTNGSSATRQADQVTNGGDSSTFNSQSGVLFIDSKAISDVACLSLHDGTDVNRVSILQYVDISRFRFLIDNNGVNQIDFYTDDFAVGLDFKIAVSYSTNNTSFFINGLEVATFNYGIMPSQGTFNQISFNLGSAGFFDFYGKTKSVQFYDIGVDIEQLTGYDSYSANDITI